MKTLLIVLLSVTAFSVKSQTSKIKTITIGSSMNIQNDWAFKIMTIQSEDSDADYIQGFEFTWGYKYVLKIKETILKNPPMDGSSIEYALIKVISKTKVPATYEFNMRLERDLYLGGGEDQVNNFIAVNDSTFSYFEKIEIEVPSKLRADFNKIMIDGESRKGIFVFINEKKIKLIGFE